MKSVTDLTGRRFGLLTVVRLADTRSPSGRVLWVCACECGAEVVAQANNLGSGNTQSCGCVGRRKAAERMAALGRLPNRTKPDDEIGYTAAHDRVRRVRGSASLHPCVDCGAQGQDWSLRPDCERARPAGGGRNAHLDISPDPDDYEARCKKCHVRLDGYGGWGWGTWRHARGATA